MRKIIPISILIALLIIAGVTTYLFYLKKNVSNQGKIERGDTQKVNSKSCLKENEFIDYTIDERYAKEIQIPTVPVTIYIKDKSTLKSKKSFTIDNITPLLRIHKCGIYVTREFNKNTPNLTEEMWKFDYSGKGVKVLTLTSFREGKPQGMTYESTFRIDPQERYLVLVQSYFGQLDYGLVIKDIKDLNNLFILTVEDVKRLNPNVMPGSFSTGFHLGDFEIKAWTDDGRYLWGTLFQGALETAYFRIKMETWETEVFSPPPDLLSGVERVENLAGYVAYVDIPTFTGIQEVYEQIIEKAKKEGKQKNLYLYNLITKEKTKIASAEPEWRFNIEWLSDTELQYELSSGEKKIYMVK